MNKLTDAEIVKALECCEISDCESCPFVHVGFTDCLKAFLDLINRQKAEIERLQKIIVGFMDEVGTWSNKYDVDISNIYKLPILAKEDFNIRNKIKTEAIKEFAERLKNEFEISSAYSFAYIECQIDNLLKEMVGD